jgi:tetratricopeptide (TPR) repeat protein
METMKRLFKGVQMESGDRWILSSGPGSFCMATLLVGLVFLAGCHTDPNVRKQKYLASGERYSAQGKYREAAIQFSNALKIDKSFGDAHYQLAQAYVHLGQYNAAGTELLRTVELEPANYKARIDLGNLMLAGRDVDHAQQQADAVLAAQPNNSDVHALLSAIDYRRGDKDQALVEIRRALELDPNRAEFHENLALMQSGDATKSSTVEDELKRAVALDSKSVNAKMLLAGFYARSGRWAEAEQAGQSAVVTDPKSISARAGLAEIYLKQGNQPKAVEVLRQASQDLSSDPQGVCMLADYYAGSGQLDKAKAEFAALAAKYPKNLSVQKGYIRVLLEVKDYATAQSNVSELMKKNSKDPEVAGLNGIVLLNAGKAADAVNALQSAVKDAPKDGFLQYWLGRAALAKGDPGLAQSSFQQAATLNPSNVEAEQELAQIAGQRGDLNQLAEVANKTIAAVPRFPGGYVWRALVEMNHGTQDKAEADLKTAISVAPNNPQAYLQLGRLRFTQKRFPEGVAMLEQALQYDPNAIDALSIEVAYDLSQKQADKALARVNAQIAKSPGNSAFYDLLARLQIQNKNLDQAAATAQKAMQLNPADGDAVGLFAQIAMMRGQTASAVNVWQQWSNAHPNDANSIAVLGMLAEAQGDIGKAEAYYRKALQIDPQQFVAANNLAYRMLINGENVDVALSLAQTARRIKPDSPSTADTLAWAYYYKGTYGFARDLLEDAIKTDPNDAAMQYHLGMVYSKLKDKSDAEAHLKKAVALSPDSPTAKDAKAALQGLG